MGFPWASAHLSAQADCKPEETAIDQNHHAELIALRSENAMLRAQLAQQAPCEVLGIASARCGGCGGGDPLTNRVFAELGKLYCAQCWEHWERCGWWYPSLRVSSTPPVIGPSGLPEFGPQDAFFLRDYACSEADFSLMERIQSELPEDKAFAEWNGTRHLGMQFEGLEARHLHATASPLVRSVVAKLEEAFGIEASASRLNIYRSDEDYKTLHADRGRDANGVPQITVGLSLGHTRELALVHWQTGLTIALPCPNGSVFAFTPELNCKFLHGVPKVDKSKLVPSCHAVSQPSVRMSIIVWGAKITRPTQVGKLASANTGGA